MTNVYLVEITKIIKQPYSSDKSKRDKVFGFFEVMYHFWLPPTSVLKFEIHRAGPAKIIITILYSVFIYGSTTISVMS